MSRHLSETRNTSPRRTPFSVPHRCPTDEDAGLIPSASGGSIAATYRSRKGLSVTGGESGGRLSAEHFLTFGNIDIDHLSLLGPRYGLSPAEAKLYEIGLPCQVVTEPRSLVKVEIYRGEGKQVEQANYFWNTLTKREPAKRWYPSVGGRPTAPRECGPRGCVVKAVLWTSLAFAKEPVISGVSGDAGTS